MTEAHLPHGHGTEGSPAAQIAAWRSRSISATALLRSLVEYDRWELPLTERSLQALRASNAEPEPWLYRDGDGQTRLFLFTSHAQWERFRQAAGVAHEQPTATTPGLSIFTRDLSSLAALHIDPLTPDALTLERDLFARVNVVADAVHVERALVQLRGGVARLASQLAAVRAFTAWHVGLRGDDASQLAIAPDPRGRRLAAVFTLSDCYEAYAREADGDDAPLNHAIMGSEALFGRLLDAGVDGIVFNCCGPSAPVAVAPAFARLVLGS